MPLPLLTMLATFISFAHWNLALGRPSGNRMRLCAGRVERSARTRLDTPACFAHFRKPSFAASTASSTTRRTSMLLGIVVDGTALELELFR